MFIKNFLYFKIINLQIKNDETNTDSADEPGDNLLNMSISLINCSFYSTKSTFFIPENNNDSDKDQIFEEVNKMNELTFSDMKNDENIEQKITDRNSRILTESIENEYAAITGNAEKLEAEPRFSTNEQAENENDSITNCSICSNSETIKSKNENSKDEKQNESDQKNEYVHEFIEKENPETLEGVLQEDQAALLISGVENKIKNDELIFTQRNLNTRKDEEEIIIESTLWPDEDEYLDSLEISNFSISELNIDKDCRLNDTIQSTELFNRNCKQSEEANKTSEEELMRKTTKSFESDRKLKSARTLKYITNKISTKVYSEINDTMSTVKSNENAAAELNLNRRSSLRIQSHIVTEAKLTKEKLKKENSNLIAQKSSKRRKTFENNKYLISTDNREENKEKFKSNKLKKNCIDKSEIGDTDVNDSKTEKSMRNRGLKRKSTDFELRTNNLDEQTLSNPSKIFFNSKKCTSSEKNNWNNLSTNLPNKKDSNSLNQPKYTPNINYLSSKPVTDAMFLSKKLKLLTKSTSSIDLKSQVGSDTNQFWKSSILDNIESITDRGTYKIISNETNYCKVTTNELSNSIFLISTHKKLTRLNNTVKLEESAPKEPIKNRCSLQINSTNQFSSSRVFTSRSLKGNNVPKIMSTGILLTEKQKKVSIITMIILFD